MSKWFGGLWRHADFRNLWIGQTASMFGAQITLVAMPLVAAVSLHATALQMGVLQAMEFLPYIFLSLFVGAWVDSRAKRPMLILADLLRALLLVIVPIGYAFHFLPMPFLFVIACLVGINTVISDIGQMSYLPSLIEKEDLVEGNSKLELSSSSSTLVGQSIGGALIQFFSAPVAILFNVWSYLLSALFLFLIQKKEPPVEAPEEEENIWGQIREGTSFVFGNKTIRTLVTTTAIFNLFTVLVEPIFILYMTRTLHLEPIFIGLIFSMSGVGSMIGALIAGKMSEKLGLGKTLVTSLLIAGVGAILIPCATLLPKLPAIGLIMLMYMIDSSMVIVYNINQRSLRAMVTPDPMQGRMNASIRMIVMGIVPIGAVLGGWIGGLIGTTFTLVIGAIGILCAAFFIALSSIRRISQLPELEEASGAATSSE